MPNIFQEQEKGGCVKFVVIQLCIEEANWHEMIESTTVRYFQRRNREGNRFYLLPGVFNYVWLRPHYLLFFLPCRKYSVRNTPVVIQQNVEPFLSFCVGEGERNMTSVFRFSFFDLMITICKFNEIFKFFPFLHSFLCYVLSWIFWYDSTVSNRTRA